MHSTCVDLAPGDWILDMYMLSFVNSMLLLSEIHRKVKGGFSPAVLGLCEVPITGWCGGAAADSCQAGVLYSY